MKNYVNILLFALLLLGTTTNAQTLKNSEYKQVKTPQGFIENKGQIIDQNYKPNMGVKYLLNMPGLNVQLKANSFSYDAYVIEQHEKVNKQTTGINMPADMETDAITMRFHRIDIEFIGANSSPKILAEEPGSDYLNYFTTGTPEGGVTKVHHYGKITYTDLYPGIDLVFFARPGTAKPVEYNFIVHPGADLSLIQWRYKGSKDIKLLEGMIRIKTAHGMLNESIPITFEKENGKTVTLNYKMSDKGIFAFNTGNYNKLSTLIIDPIPDIKWSTYYGGSGTDQAYALKVDPSGNVLVTGYTTSTSGIATTGAYQTTFAGSNDIILASFNASGTRTWCTYYGGSGFENGSAYGGNLYDNGGGLVIDGSGNVYITGFSTSTSQIATTGAFQTANAGSYDAFLAKFSSSGSLLWGTYLGGSGIDMGYGIAIDASGYIYFTGRTESTAGIASTGANQTSVGGSFDAFIAKFSSSGTRIWSTYYGGSAEDMGKDISVDINSNVFITGYAASTSAIATAGAYQTAMAGTSDAFIAKFNTSGTLLWGTYYGGTSGDYGQGTATDASGNLYVTGYTVSTSGIASTGAYQTIFGGGTSDAFLAKFNPSGSLIWGTYFGGSLEDKGRCLTVDASGNVLITGYTVSTSAIATTGAYQATYGGGTYDGYVAKFSAAGSVLWGSYFGGSTADNALGITTDNAGNAYFTGQTNSTAGVATTGAFQTTNAGGYDVFLAKFLNQELQNDAGISAINAPAGTIVPANVNVTAMLKNFGKDTLKSVSLRWSVNGTLQTSPANWSGVLIKNATAGPITFGNYTFGTGYYTIKAWTTSPNGKTDSNSTNDTSSITFISCNPASGTYVIDPAGGGDFKTFNLALYWLKNCGISGPVTFRVRPGTYNEQLTISAITGASATNKIVFESYNLDSTSVNLTYAALGTADNWVVRFNGCSYVTFRKMTISATGTTYGNVVEYITAANYDVLESNILQTPITTSTSYAVVYSNTTLDQNNTIKNNVITGGYYGIYWYGVSAASLEAGNLIEGNTIRDFNYYGIYTAYQNALKIRKNTIISSAAAGATNGIYATSCNNNIEFTQNNIQLAASSTIYGITLSSCVGTAALRGNVSNNFVSTLGTSVGTIYGIYFTTSSYQDLNYNSVSISNTVPTPSTSRAFCITGGTASTVNVLNNNFINLGGNPSYPYGGYAIYTGSASTALGTCNYNNLYATATALCYWTTNNASLAAWRTASSKDGNSVNKNPGYISTTDLHVNSPDINGMGTPVTGFTVDIDGETRQNPPDIGADEFNLVANDAGVTAMVAPLPPCPGSNIVSVKVKNYGTSPLTSVSVGWSINGVVQTPLTTTISSINQNQETTLNLGSYSFNVGSYYNLKFWVYQPNGVTDGNARNDTFINKNLATSLGGNYTIGGSTANYPTIMAAIADIQAKGICTPTIFRINKGTYLGRIVIPPIPGASAVNTITFNGSYADSVKITYAGTASALATVLFSGADYITFKNVTIENTATATAYAVCFIGQADYNTIDSCKLLVDQTGTVATVAAVVSTSTETSVSGYANNANYTTISNCLIKGGYYGIKFNGTSATGKCTNNSVINCKFDKVYYYGIYFIYQTYPTFLNNSITGFRSPSASGIYNYYGGTNPIINGNYIIAYYGIYNYYNNTNTQIIGNTILNATYGIYNYGTSTSLCDNPQIIGNTIRSLVYGLYQGYCTSSNIERNDIYAGYSGLYITYETNPVDSSVIVNNFAHQGGGTYTYGNGLYLTYSTKVVVYHNTFQTDTSYASASTSYGTCYIRLNTGTIKVKNNIFKSIGNLYCFNTDGTGIAAGDLDYNIYYTVTNGNTIAYWNTTTYTSFIVWKSSMPAFNKNSLNVDPGLVSKYNLHLKAATIFNRGIPLGVDRDVDNDYRCLPVPTIGADEFIHPYDKPDADFLADTFACISSPFTFLNKAGLNDAKRHFWYVNNVFKSNAINFTYTFQNPGINTITLITQNCSTTDTVTKTLNIGLATKPPVSYFVVNKNKVEVNEPVTLLDISSSCPEHWKWTVSPDSFFDPSVGHNVCTYTMTPGADTTQSPQIAFIYTGIYSICLTTSNSINMGTTYCLNKYIEVIPAVKLCYFPYDSKESSGTIYDDGGITGQYGANKNCGLLIHPCTKSVSLVFTTFDLAAGDYIEIYDGKDNLSTPLWNSILYPFGMNNINRPPSTTDTFIAKSGSMYIEISTDASTQGNGIVAKWFSIPETYTPTVASFDISDTICNGVSIVFSNTSQGIQNDYFWDFHNDGITDASTFNGVYKYMLDGDYNVKLTAKGCGGTDSLIKKVYVNTSLATPVFELLTSNKKPNAYYELVTLTQNTLQNCVDTTIWDITPKSYSLVSGKLDNSSSITLKFNDTVCYNFSLIGKYHGFSDTMYYPCFIKPISYCKPLVVNTSPDVGISRVRLNTIDNYSDIGVTDYTDYSNTIFTDLERGASYNITLDRITNSNPMNRRVWIDYNRDGNFDNNNELVAFENSDYTLSWTGKFIVPEKLDVGITRIRIGTSLGASPNNPCGPNVYGEFEDYRLNIILDRTKPVMTLVGPSVIHIQECTAAFYDPSVVVTDNADTNLADSVVITGSVDPRKSGNYIITYNVKDASGNAANQLTRTVIVDKEPIPPQITLKGNPSEVIQIFNSYKDAGYVAFDTCSGLDTVIATNGIDTANIGTYFYSYRAFDKNGNFADVSRTIYVMDTIDPVITSISDDTINVNIYNILPNPLYSVTDNYYSVYSIKITIKGSYYDMFPNGQATIPGFYTFIYIATDGSGNSDSISFVINVIDKVKPKLKLLGEQYFYICRFETITDPGYTLTDNYDPNPTIVKSGSYISDYLINKMNGNYELIYTATDNSGNSSVDSRFIFVSDTGNCFSSINQSYLTNEVNLYPNPGNGKFNIEFNITKEQIIGISVYNALGNLVYQNNEKIKPGQVKTYDYYYMKPGMYFIQLIQGEKITTLKYNLMK